MELLRLASALELENMGRVALQRSAGAKLTDYASWAPSAPGGRTTLVCSGAVGVQPAASASR